MTHCPPDLKYTKDHEWARLEGDAVRVGITQHAVDQLGDVTLIDLPKPGTLVKRQERFGDIESVKTVSELFAPIGGKIVVVNDVLEREPEQVNVDPYNAGWLVVLAPSQLGELDTLMDADAYAAFLGTLGE